MPASPNKGVYNFLINMTLSFKSTSKTSAVVGNAFRKLKQDIDAYANSAKNYGNKLKANIKEISKATTEASKRASYFDTVWGKLFGLMMKFYTIKFIVNIFASIGKAIYEATTKAGQFEKQIRAMYGFSMEGEKMLYNIKEISNSYGFLYKDVANISRELRGFNEDVIISVLKLNDSIAYGQDVAKDVIKALNNMRDTGKVSIDDLNKLAKDGIYVWEELKKQLNLTDDQLKTIEKDNIDIEKAIKAVSDAVRNTATNAVSNISTTQQEFNKLKNTISDIKKQLNEKLSADNIFSSMIRWIDNVIQKWFDLMLNLKASQKNISSKQVEEYKKYYEQNKKYYNELLKQYIETFSNNLFSKILNIPTLQSKYTGQQGVEKTIEMSKRLEELWTKFLKAEIDQKKFLNDFVSLLREYYKNVPEKEIKNAIEEYIKSQSGSSSGTINSLINFFEIVKKLSELGYFDLVSSSLKAGENKQENAPMIVNEERISGASGYTQKPKYLSMVDYLLDELSYNIQYGIIDLLDGIMNFMLQYSNQYISKETQNIITNLLNNMFESYDVSSLKGISEAYNAIYEYAISELERIRNEMIANGETQEDILIYELKMQEMLKKITEEHYNAVMQFRQKELEKLKEALELQKQQIDMQNEINKKNKFYQLLLSFTDIFEEEMQTIVVVSEETGEAITEIISTGVPVVKNEIKNIFDSIYYYATNIINSLKTQQPLKTFPKSLGELYKSLLTALYNSFEGFINNLVKNFGNLVLGSFFSALSQVQGIQALLDPLSYMLSVIASYILPTLNDLLTPIIGAITTLAILISQSILPILNGLMPFVQVLSQYLASILTLLQPLIIAWGLIGQVLINALLYPLTAILRVLSPIIIALIPIFKFFAKVLYWVGFIINGVIQAIAGTINVFISVINSVLKALGKKTIPLLQTAQYMSYSDFNESLDTNTGISVSDLVSNAYNPSNNVIPSSSSSGASNYTTEAQRPITVNINVENWFGDETATRKLALIVKNEFEILGVI